MAIEPRNIDQGASDQAPKYDLHWDNLDPATKDICLALYPDQRAKKIPDDILNAAAEEGVSFGYWAVMMPLALGELHWAGWKVTRGNSINLTLIDVPIDDENDYNPWMAEPGQMWRCADVPVESDFWEYHELEDRNPCWVIRLPGRMAIWHTNSQAGKGGFWQIWGDPPAITVSPSIDIEGTWHGFITRGHLHPPEPERVGRRHFLWG